MFHNNKYKYTVLLPEEVRQSDGGLSEARPRGRLHSDQVSCTTSTALEFVGSLEFHEPSIDTKNAWHL